MTRTMIVDEKVTLFTKLFVALTMATVPVAPSGAYNFIWGSNAFIIQAACIVVISIACFVDVTLGLLLTALAIAVSIQKQYRIG